MLYIFILFIFFDTKIDTVSHYGADQKHLFYKEKHTPEQDLSYWTPKEITLC